MSCQIRDYQGAPLKLTALFHFLLPYQLFAKPVREMERLPRVSERGQKGADTSERGGVRARQLQRDRRRKVQR